MYHIVTGICPECGATINYASCEPLNCIACGYVAPEDTSDNPDDKQGA
jgi:tRNA(Ile2) C34 agmatinyltransferase TiaS